MLNLFQKVSDFCLFIYFLSSWRDRMLHSQIINIYVLVDCETVAFDRPFHGFIYIRLKLEQPFAGNCL